jgi:hypothetical protein
MALGDMGRKRRYAALLTRAAGLHLHGRVALNHRNELLAEIVKLGRVSVCSVAHVVPLCPVMPLMQPRGASSMTV